MFSESPVSPREGGRAAKAAATRAALLDAVVDLVALGGVSVVTHRAVAAQAGVSPALVAYHFSTIEELLLATSNALTAGAVHRLGEAVREVSERVSLLEVTARYLSEQFGSHRKYFVARLELDLAKSRGGSIAPEVVAANRMFLDLIRPFVADDRAARTLLAAIVGFALQGVLGLEPCSEADCRRFLADLYDRHGVREPADVLP